MGGGQGTSRSRSIEEVWVIDVLDRGIADCWDQKTAQGGPHRQLPQ